MKKLLFAFVMILGLSFISCGGSSKENTESTDTTVVDTVEFSDTINAVVDTLTAAL